MTDADTSPEGLWRKQADEELRQKMLALRSKLVTHDSRLMTNTTARPVAAHGRTADAHCGTRAFATPGQSSAAHLQLALSPTPDAADLAARGGGVRGQCTMLQCAAGLPGVRVHPPRHTPRLRCHPCRANPPRASLARCLRDRGQCCAVTGSRRRRRRRRGAGAGLFSSQCTNLSMAEFNMSSETIHACPKQYERAQTMYSVRLQLPGMHPCAAWVLGGHCQDTDTHWHARCCRAEGLARRPV